MDNALQWGSNSENPRGLGKQVDPIDAPVCRALLCYIALIAGQKKRCPGRPIGGLNLQQAFAAGLIERQNIVACPIPVLSGNPSNLPSQVRALGAGELSALEIENKFLSRFAERAIATVSFHRVEFSYKVLKAFGNLLIGRC